VQIKVLLCRMRRLAVKHRRQDADDFDAAYWKELLAGKYPWSTIGKRLRAKGLVRA